MNGILKSIAVVAIVSFFLSACGGESSGESSGTMDMSGGLSGALLSDAGQRGLAIFQDPQYACTSCHGAQGEGTNAGGPVNNTNDCPSCVDLATLTNYNDLLMPATPYQPSACVGACASDVSQFIIEGLIQGRALPGANNNPAILVNPTSGLVTTEAGGTASFTVSLNSLPTDNVDIALVSSNTAEGNVDQAALTFTTANWNQPQTVMVTGADDAVLDGNIAYTIVITATSNDVDYGAIDPADVAVTNNDNEVPPPGVVTVTPTSGLVTTEDGGTATFTIVLGTQPTANVSIGLSSSNAAEGTVSPASVVFTNANYNVAQTVTVTGVDDIAAPAVDGNIAYSIVTAAAISNDPSYSNFAVDDVSVTNNDNDVQPVISAFTADPVSNAGAPIPYNGMVTLNWASDGDTCTAGGATANNQWTGTLLPTSMQTLTNLTTAGVNTFTLVCTKGGINSAVASVDVTVMAQPGAPTVTLSANPTMLPVGGGDTTLTWTTTDADSCVATSNPANANWDNANKAVNGNQLIQGLTAASNTFSLNCTNAGGLNTQQDVVVTVVQPNPTVNLTASPTVVSEGGTTKLTWTVTDMQSCAAVDNGAWTGVKGVLATQEEDIANLFAATTFTINCIGLDNQMYSSNASITIDPTSTGQYLYSTATFGGQFTCAESFCHGPAGDQGVLLNNKAVQCAKYTNTAGLVAKIADTMPPGFDANQQFLSINCGADCATKILNYMFLNFYGGNTTDCEGGALPMPIP